MKNCASFGGGDFDAEDDGDERLALVDSLEEGLEQLEQHRVDAHDELRDHPAPEEVDRLVVLERLVPVNDEDEVLEGDAEVRNDALRRRRDDRARRPLFVDGAELPDAVEARREVWLDLAESPAP